MTDGVDLSWQASVGERRIFVGGQRKMVAEREEQDMNAGYSRVVGPNSVGAKGDFEHVRSLKQHADHRI